jgi:hypothetical protein
VESYQSILAEVLFGALSKNRFYIFPAVPNFLFKQKNVFDIKKFNLILKQGRTVTKLSLGQKPK